MLRKNFLFQLVPIACVTVYHWEESRAIFFTPSHYTFINIDQIPSRASFLQAKPQLSPCRRDAPVPWSSLQLIWCINYTSYFCTIGKFADAALSHLPGQEVMVSPIQSFPGGMKYLHLRTWVSFDVYWLTECFGFSCRWQQKRHVASPPPAGVRRRMKRNRQKLGGRDKGSLTEQQTKEQEQQRYR